MAAPAVGADPARPEDLQQLAVVAPVVCWWESHGPGRASPGVRVVITIEIIGAGRTINPITLDDEWAQALRMRGYDPGEFNKIRWPTGATRWSTGWSRSRRRNPRYG